MNIFSGDQHIFKHNTFQLLLMILIANNPISPPLKNLHLLILPHNTLNILTPNGFLGLPIMNEIVINMMPDMIIN